MKLTKRSLKRIVRSSIIEMGYTEFEDSIIGSQGYFVKKLQNNLYLSLGLTIHRFYDSLFVPTYYLSNITTWSTLGFDIPFESYERLGKFLKEKEREQLLDLSINGKTGWDTWFDASHQINIDNFIRTVNITEDRFINNPELIEKINASTRLKTLSNLSKETQQCLQKNEIADCLKYTPNTEKDNIPLIWFQAAETAIINNRWHLSKNYVEIIASDAYIKYRLE